jgi:hypothetical protein
LQTLGYHFVHLHGHLKPAFPKDIYDDQYPTRHRGTTALGTSIDPAVAAIMSTSRAVAGATSRSMYDTASDDAFFF